MKPPAALSGLDDLLDLGHGDGADMRRTLLRVLTDLYLQRPAHTLEDEHCYTELALRLIDASDVSERAALAARLAAYPSAPKAVMARLARDVVEVAGPILEHASCLSPADLKALAEERGGACAEISPQCSAAAPAAPAPCAAPAAAAEAAELAELFFAAGAPERRLILLNLDFASLVPAQPFCAPQRADVWRLETAALQHNTETLIRELARMVGVTRTQARRIIDDELREPIVVAAKALDLTAEVLQRLLLFMSPWGGQSIDRLQQLVELHGEISVDAARRLVAIWRDAQRVEESRVRHEPVTWRTAAENARRALSEVSYRPQAPHGARLRRGDG